MAKKKFEVEDDYDWDAGLDMPEFDFDAPPPKDDRSPVTKFASGVGRGAIDAVDPSFIKSIARKALPRGYGQGMDLLDQGTSTLRNLYNTADKELKPAINDIKRVTKRILPSVEGVLPKGVTEKMKKWATQDQRSAQASQEEMREAGLQADLSEIFTAQTEVDQANRNEDKAQDVLRDQIQQKQHKASYNQMDAMRQSIQMGVSFDTKITAKYQRKHLEVAYRSYFLQMDLLEETKKNNADTRQNLEGILKNTGLPEFAKLKNSERLHEVLRNKFIEGINDSIFSKRRQFMNNLGKRIATQAGEKIRGFSDGVSQGAGIVDSLADLREMQAEMGGPQTGPGEMAGNIVGGMAANGIGNRVGKKLRSYADGNEKVVRVGNRISDFATNTAQYAHEWARSDKHENSGNSFLDSLVRFGKDNILGALSGQDTSLTEDKLGEGNNPDIFGRQTNKSITEIIPGYLARILREIQVFRTGNTETELLQYDFTKNRFAGRSTVAKSVRESLVGDRETESTRNQVDRLIDELEKDKEKKLTPEQRKILGRKLLKDNLSNKRGDADRYSTEEEWSGDSFAHSDQFSNLFKDYFKEDKSWDKRRIFGNEFANLGSYISDSRRKIQDHVNTGSREHLEGLGLLNEGSSNIDMDKLYEYYYGGSGAGPTPAGEQLPGNGPMPLPRPPSPLQEAPLPPPPVPPHPLGPVPPTPGAGTINMVADPAMFDKVIEAIKSISTLVQASSSDATLLRIEAKINEGIDLRSGDGSGGGPSGGPGFGDIRLGDIPKRLLGAGRTGFNWARGKGKAGTTRALGFGKKAWKWGNEMKDKALAKAREINDVYVQGEIRPRLTRAGIEAGRYRDQLTGQVITAWSDITGAVVDEDGNIVLSVEDLQKAFMKTNLGQKAIKGLVAVKDWSIGAFIGGTKKLRAAGLGVYGFAIDAGKKLWELTDQPQDVYVRGETAPRLLGITMKTGGYASRVTSKPVTRPSQIDGPVYDMQGQIVLTAEDIAKGLMGADGRELVTGAKKLMRIGMDTVNKVKEKAIWLKDQVMDKATKARDWLKGKFDLGSFGEKLGKFFTTGPLGISAKKTVDLLTEIRNILNDRLPGKKRTIAGDVDGDGVREGSWEDLQRKKKGLIQTAREKAEKLKGDGFAKSKDLGTAAMDKIKGVMDFFKKRKKRGEEDEDGGLLDDFSDAGFDGNDRDNRRSRRTRRARPARGLWGKTKSLAGKAGRGIAGAGRAALGLIPGAGLISGAGSMLGGAGRAALAVGSLGASGIASAATGIASVAGSILGGIGALLSAPVVLGALGVAALGVGAYYGYKYLTKKRLGTLSSIRYAQYGFLKADTDHVQKVFELEDTLEPGVVFSGGNATIDQSKVDIKKAIESFGVTIEDENQRTNWEAWFMNRFKPVYLLHMGVLAGMQKKKLADVDDLKGEERKQYLNGIKFPGGPYDYKVSPFPDLPMLLATSKEVQAAIQVASEEVAKDAKGTGVIGEEAKAAAVTTAASIVTSASAASIVDASGNLSQAAKALTAGTAGGLLSGAGITTLTSAEVMSDVLYTGRVDALMALRLRTYGLMDLATDKVRILQRLENMTLVDVTFKDDTASWNGSIENMLNTAAAGFGVPSGDNPNAIDWMTWFSKRFLPTYLKYLTVLKKVSGKTDMKVAEQSLKPQDKLDIAQVVYTTNVNYSGSMTSVWQVPATPWPGYTMNMDVKSIDGNLQALKDAAQSATLSEESGKTGKSGLASKDSPIPDGATGTKPGFFSRFFGGKDEDGNKAKGGWFSNAGSTIMDSAKSGLEAMGIGGGREMEHPGKGTGGDINSLPNPKGKGYAAMKELLSGVGKMTGVDEKMLASVIAIESGFDPSIKASSSSATGLGQFIKATWQTMLAKYGAKYGIAPDTPPTDARANALMTAEFLKENANAIKGAVNRKLTDTDLYLAHFMGAGGARKFLSADPASSAVELMPAAAKANPSIFYDKNGKPRTVGEVYGVLNGRVRASAKRYGVDDGSEKLQTTGTTATTTAPAADKAASNPAITTNPLGNFKTMEQTPGVPLSESTNTPVATTPQSASNDSDGAPSAPVSAAKVAGMGFQTQRSANQADQAQFQTSQFIKSFGMVEEYNRQQVELQTKMLEGINTLVKQGQGNAGTNDAPNKPVDPGTVISPIKPRAQQVQAAPVPMRKNASWPS